MKRLLAILWLTASLASAQTGTSPNLVNTTNSQSSGWVGTIPYTGTGGGYSGGSTPGYNAATNTIHFGYNQGTAAYTYAFSQALQNSGMTITGYNYSWQYLNQNPYNGTLSAKVNFAAVDGSPLHTKLWTLGTTTDWTTVTGTETFANTGLPASNIANFSLSFTGKDARWWAGYYGPQVKNPSLSLNYTFDACSSNPLSNPSCSGYAQAYLTQQCTANPLYSTECSGYAAAYQQQQCTINPLYSPQCSGYAVAYHDQQCSISPLYASDCIGYRQAYHDQQCTINPLYATDCVGYASAYRQQQCTANPLYSTDCAGYEQAYLNAQCIKDSLYSKLCTGYATAYAIKYLVPVENSSAVNQVLSNNAAAVAAPPVPPPVATPVEMATTAPATTSATSMTSVNSVVAPPPAPAGNPMSPTAQSAPPPPPPAAGGQEPPKPSGPPTARQALAERRQEAARNEAVAKGKDLAKSMGNAKSLDDQIAAQGLVAAAMGYNPNFSAYQNAIIPDTSFYKPYDVYKNQKNIDNRNGLRMFGGSDIRHQEMVNSQYNKEK